MLTARNHPDDVLRGFTAGADDYLTKPFELAMLLARLRSLLRRNEWLLAAAASPAATDDAASQPPDSYAFGEISVDFDRLELCVRGKVFPLTLMEANLLRYLIAHEGKPVSLMEASLLRYFIEHRNQNVSRKQILEEVWGLHEDTDTRAIDNFIVRLRRYIEDDPTKPRHLLTVRGVGYRFVAAPE